MTPFQSTVQSQSFPLFPKLYRPFFSVYKESQLQCMNLTRSQWKLRQKLCSKTRNRPAWCLEAGALERTVAFEAAACRLQSNKMTSENEITPARKISVTRANFALRSSHRWAWPTSQLTTTESCSKSITVPWKLKYYIVTPIYQCRTINCFCERNRSHVPPAKPRQNESSAIRSTITQLI